MEADQLGRLRDILEASRLIASYVKGTTETDFRTDTQKQDAVVRRMEIIGEATAHLNEETRRAVPELPFRKMRGMRNIVAHEPSQREKQRQNCVQHNCRPQKWPDPFAAESYHMRRSAVPEARLG
jgi:uncharacterized protein with HEPN domain